jgi:hypothetical protein
MKVDILIPSKDRPAQLHQLLSLISKNVNGIGQITITIQASNIDYKRGYEILNDRLLKDDHFKLLRNKSKITILYRDELSKISEALDHLGNSELLLVLSDDELFFGSIDFENNFAVKKFIDDSNILACSIRLGKNITPILPYTHKYFTRAQPSFIEQSPEHLIWTWPDNLDTYHWACIFSTSGHIYRKNEYLKMFRLFGNENFLLIEGNAVKRFVKESLFISNNLLSFVQFLDHIIEKVLRSLTKINPQPVIFNLFIKYLYRLKVFEKKSTQFKMISLGQSVTAAIDINTSQVWRDDSPHFISNDAINQKYLHGYVFSNDVINSIEFDEPNLRDSNKIKGVSFINYVSGVK